MFIEDKQNKLYQGKDIFQNISYKSLKKKLLELHPLNPKSLILLLHHLHLYYWKFTVFIIVDLQCCAGLRCVAK